MTHSIELYKIILNTYLFQENGRLLHIYLDAGTVGRHDVDTGGRQAEAAYFAGKDATVGGGHAEVALANAEVASAEGSTHLAVGSNLHNACGVVVVFSIQQFFSHTIGIGVSLLFRNEPSFTLVGVGGAFVSLAFRQLDAAN